MSDFIRHISRLRLSHYRNYGSGALDLDSRHVVLTGPNGAGKTNLLEALSLFSPGRGLRRASFDTLMQSGSDAAWAVAVTVETPDGPVDLGTGLSPGDTSRRLRINGANARSMEEMTDYIRLLWLVPDMDGLFRGSPGDRRRFLDRLVMTLIPSHGVAVANFEKAMRQRNRLLDENADPAWIGAVEAQMAEEAAAMHFARADSLSHLQALVAEGIDTDAFPAADLALTPLFADESQPDTAAALEAELMARWVDQRPLDRAAGRTTFGPHRIDFEVMHRQKVMPAGLCSTGEQKALLIGLVLAHARLVGQMSAITPLLLLDEVAAHLDPNRRAALFSALDTLHTQCWMTGTDAALFSDIGMRGRFVTVREGRIFDEGSPA